MSVDDRVFMVARAMARADGHDPDAMGVPCNGGMYQPTFNVRGTGVAFGERIPIWHLYTGLATAALETIKKLPE